MYVIIDARIIRLTEERKNVTQRRQYRGDATVQTIIVLNIILFELNFHIYNATMYYIFINDRREAVKMLSLNI